MSIIISVRNTYTNKGDTKIKNAILVLFVIIAVIGMVVGAGIIWIVLYNLFHGFGMNWFAGIAGCVVFGVFNAIYNKVTGEC